MNKLITSITGLLCSFTFASSHAHHSFAMFDMDHEMTLSGTVKEFQFTNPHTWIFVHVPNADGGMDQWAIAGGSPNVIARFGWSSKTLKPGDKVTLVVNPIKNGSKAGAFIRVTMEDGRTLAQFPKLGPPPPP
jgi:hypothetical protein